MVADIAVTEPHAEQGFDREDEPTGADSELAVSHAFVSPYGKSKRIRTMMSTDSSWLAPVGPPISGFTAG